MNQPKVDKDKATARPGDQIKTPATPARKPTDKPTSPAPTRADKLARAERYSLKPEFWDSILDSIPPWGDEIAAILLIVFGIVSFLSLLNVSSDATISTAWSNALTQLFGYGGVIISTGIFALGVIILLPKLGVVIRFPGWRVLALEIGFLSALALLHLASGDPELRTVARAGQGGGQVGWAMSVVIVGLFGNSVGVIFYSVLLAVSMAVVVGVRPEHLSNWLQTRSARLHAYAQTMLDSAAEIKRKRREQPAPPPDRLGAALRGELPKAPQSSTQRSPANSVMRIRPNPDNIPPSLRPETMPELPDEDELKFDPAEHPLFARDEESATMQAIGVIQQPQGKRPKGTPIMVERPDGRIKRYFTVDSMREPKYVGKRSPDLPPLDLLRDVELNPPDEQEINRNVVLIENTLLEFDIDVDVVDVKVGPTVTQYAVQPFRESLGETGETFTSRTRVNKIASLVNDLALALSAKRLRMETPVPGHTYLGIEVPNKNPSTVALRSVYESRLYYEETLKNKSPLLIPLGRDVSGAPLAVDLGTMPHLLIAGTTGSGKSVCIAAIATALLLNNMPDVIKLVLLDPKMVELARFNGVPHLIGPVETDQERIIGVLRWCTREMDRRYRLLEEHAARNIDTFNARLGRRRRDEYLPYIVIMVDEIGDLMMSRPEETEKTITRLAQMARAVGMHLIVATQRPSVDVITGLIKANFPSRISFNVASGIDSRVILDTVGAETLLGKGDMLFQAADMPAPRRLQGCYVSDDEVRSVVEYWKSWRIKQVAEGNLEKNPVAPWERGLTRREFLSETDPMLEQAIALVIAEGEASASLIQRRLGVGYPRAARIMDLMQELGIIGEMKQGGRGREVIIKPGKDPFKELIERKMKGLS